MRNYTMTLRTEGPVFVGDGGKIGKKEYIFMSGERRVYVPDMVKMYQYFEERRLMDDYQDYLLRDRRDFAAWMREKKILTPRQFLRWTAYSVDSADAVFEEKGKKEILTFQKDAYGCPYIPGSSAKGMLRTILLSNMLLQDRDKLETERQVIAQTMQRVSAGQADVKRTTLLRQETGRLEQDFLNTLNRNDKRKSDAVNDIMCGPRVSDSRPLRAENLILCQKIDVTTDGQRKSLPILRECLRPGTEITFELTVIPEYFRFPAEQILRAAERCHSAYDRCFRSAFSLRGIQSGGTVYLGGGCGYATKTLAYPLLGKNGVETVSRIIDATLPFKTRSQHKHSLDKRKGVSPHMLKCTQYRSQIYEMGACSIAIKENL